MHRRRCHNIRRRLVRRFLQASRASLHALYAISFNHLCISWRAIVSTILIIRIGIYTLVLLRKIIHLNQKLSHALKLTVIANF